MEILHRDALGRGGFAGIEETRIVTDSRLFKRKRSETAEGIGQFVYLADAEFTPFGETGMHPHKEIDVISVMIHGRVSHAGSLEHGQSLVAGDVQVQRAGGEGFSHNEMNPDDAKNRMIQLWALPEEGGRPAGYKHYRPKAQGITRIYGGLATEGETFDSSTTIDILRLSEGECYDIPHESLSYVTEGELTFTEQDAPYKASDGSLVRGNNLILKAKTSCQVIVIRKAD